MVSDLREIIIELRDAIPDLAAIYDVYKPDCVRELFNYGTRIMTASPWAVRRQHQYQLLRALQSMAHERSCQSKQVDVIVKLCNEILRGI